MPIQYPYRPRLCRLSIVAEEVLGPIQRHSCAKIPNGPFLSIATRGGGMSSRRFRGRGKERGAPVNVDEVAMASLCPGRNPARVRIPGHRLWKVLRRLCSGPFAASGKIAGHGKKRRYHRCWSCDRSRSRPGQPASSLFRPRRLAETCERRGFLCIIPKSAVCSRGDAPRSASTVGRRWHNWPRIGRVPVAITVGPRMRSRSVPYSGWTGVKRRSECFRLLVPGGPSLLVSKGPVEWIG